MRRLPIVLVLILLTAAPAARALDVPCAQAPDPARWTDAGTPDPAVEHMRITVHRGAANLAPENTIPAFEYAIAYGMDMIEVDVQQTLDGRYVVLHDYEVSQETNGEGYVFTMTYDEATALNAADHGEWRTSEYKDELVPGLEQVLQLASDAGVGINFDLKESVTNAAGVALLAAEYPGVIESSIFQPYVPVRAESILAAVPAATIMHNSQSEDTPPALYYAIAAEYDWFGSDLDNYSAEAIAAIHDACDFVQPNVYSNNHAQEEAALLEARARGADGAMVNNPEVAADALDRPVTTSFTTEPGTACLVGHEGFGLPQKDVLVGAATATTGRGGCVPWAGEPLSFAGDGSAGASTWP